MNEFIKRNRGFFRTLSGLLGLVSSVLLILGIVWALLESVALGTRIGDWPALREEWANTPHGIFLFILLGLVARGMSQLLRYLHDPEYRPQWLLQHGDKLLYVYAAVYVASVLLDYILFAIRRWSEGPGWLVLGAVLTTLYAFAAGLVLLGLGQILKRIMPVIDEVRTLA